MGNKTVPAKTRELSRNYDRVAWFYEKIAKFYSTNQIRASKRYQLNFIAPGDKVLYLGAGAGEDAVMAARLGAIVTCIDISAGMLDRVQRKLDREKVSAELICADAFRFDRPGYFDVVAANYFLNVFRRDSMIRMLDHSAQFLRPGGKYLIADVSLPQGTLLSRGFNLCYLKLAMASFWTMGLVPWHENYDYVAHFAAAHLELQHIKFFRFAKRGPILFQTIVANQRCERLPDSIG